MHATTKSLKFALVPNSRKIKVPLFIAAAFVSACNVSPQNGNDDSDSSQQTTGSTSTETSQSTSETVTQSDTSTTSTSTSTSTPDEDLALEIYLGKADGTYAPKLVLALPPDEAEALMPHQVRDVVGMPGEEVVEPHHRVALAEEPIGEVRAEEPGRPRDEYPHALPRPIDR